MKTRHTPSATEEGGVRRPARTSATERASPLRRLDAGQVLALQSAAGNRAVRSLLATPVVQREPVPGDDGKFTDFRIPGATLEQTGVGDTNGNTEYRIVDTTITFTYNDRTDQYSVAGRPIADPATLLPVKVGSKRKREDNAKENIAPLKKKARIEDEDKFFSEMSESEDDASTELTPEGKFGLMTARGPRKKEAHKKMALDKKGRALDLSDPHFRKGYSAHRTTTGDPSVPSTTAHKVVIGHQQITMQGGRGHYVTRGGNNDRPRGVVEPPGNYRELFEHIRTLGDDPNAVPLLQAAGDDSTITRGRLDDRQISRITLHYMNYPAPTTLVRSQLTEAMTMLMAIFTAEQSRAFEAKPPYDASLLIKAGLRKIGAGELSLGKVFYSGRKSVFLGAPTQKKESKNISGAKQLRDPLAHPEALKRQMDTLPDNKLEFKRSINELRTNSSTPFVELTDAITAAVEAGKREDQNTRASALLDRAKHMKIPGAHDLDEFLNNKRKSVLHNTLRIIAVELEAAAGNETATATLKKARKTLWDLKKAAKATLGIGAKAKR